MVPGVDRLKESVREGRTENCSKRYCTQRERESSHMNVLEGIALIGMF